MTCDIKIQLQKNGARKNNYQQQRDEFFVVPTFYFLSRRILSSSFSCKLVLYYLAFSFSFLSLCFSI